MGSLLAVPAYLVGSVVVMPACSDGLTVTLGQARGNAVVDAGVPVPIDAKGANDAHDANTSPGRVRFGQRILHDELSSPEANENPTLTSNMLDIYWISPRAGGPGHGDVWHASRANVSDRFSNLEVVKEVSLDSKEKSAAISNDGLTLWFASDREGGNGSYDIWVSTRTSTTKWSMPEPVTALNSESEDIPRPPGQHGLVMPLASTRESDGGDYQNFLATRASLTAKWGKPVRITELDPAAFSNVDGFLDEDGLAFYFNSDRPAHASEDLFVATRRTTASPFDPPEALDEINTQYGERDPWLSQDGKHLFFSSNRDGPYQIYEVTR